MNIQSNVSSRQRPDVPATFESLNDDTLTTTLQFVGDKSYRSFGGINKRCREIYLSSGMTKKTFLYGYAPLSVIQERIERATISNWTWFERVAKGVVLYNRRDAFEWALQERKDRVLRGICHIAGREGRIDLLDEVWNNIDEDDNKREIFYYVDGRTASGGELNVLKWFETKELSICKYLCGMRAARDGQLHVMKWLIEEKGLELNGGYYTYAAQGNQLHEMKWLREQGCPWSKNTFKNAAKVGNLNILQWLHDEGCPWPEDNWCRVHERSLKPEYELKPEALAWLRANGYSDKIVPHFFPR